MIGSSWASGSWVDDAWAEGTWVDVIRTTPAPFRRPRLGALYSKYDELPIYTTGASKTVSDVTTGPRKIGLLRTR